MARGQASKSPDKRPVLAISVVKREGVKLGLKFSQEQLLVEQVRDGGLVSEWNRKNPTKVVREGDQIVEVNGKRLSKDGAALLIKEMGEKPSLDMRLAQKAVVASAKQASKSADNRPVLAISIVKREGMKLGVKFSQEQLLVEQVRDGGLVSEWNRNNPAKVVREGDQIVEVNGKQLFKDGAAVLIKEMGEKPSLQMRLAQKAAPSTGDESVFTVSIARREGVMLGIGFNATHLLIERVKEDGLLPEWNRENPAKAVREGDQIVEVNGKRLSDDGAALLVKEMAEKSTLEIRILRQGASESAHQALLGGDAASQASLRARRLSAALAGLDLSGQFYRQLALLREDAVAVQPPRHRPPHPGGGPRTIFACPCCHQVFHTFVLDGRFHAVTVEGLEGVRVDFRSSGE